MDASDRPDLSDLDDRFRKFCDRVGVFFVVAVIVYEVVDVYLRVGYDNFYDEGVYLQSARMMFRGYHLYQTIFNSQPPLWLPLVYTSFRIGGLNLASAQIAIGVTAIVAILAAALATRQLAGWGAAGLAAGAIVFSPMEVWIPRAMPAIPAIALSTAAIVFALRYVRRGSMVSLCVAAILVTCSILVKLLGFLTLPAVILIVGARHWNTDGIGWTQGGKLFARDVGLVLGIAMIITVGFMLEYGPVDVWHQAVEFHWLARSTMKTDSVAHQVNSVESIILRDRMPCALAFFAMLCLYAGAEGIGLVGWICFTIGGLLFHQPLFKHHLLILIPPLVIAGAVGWNHFPKLGDWLRNHSNGTGVVQIATALILFVDITLILLLLSAFGVRLRTMIADRVPNYQPDIAAAQLIQHLTTSKETILTDAQGIAFLADRDVPAELTDTSFKRISTGYLTLSEVIVDSDRHNVRLVLLWTGRLASIPGMTQWLAARFPYHRTLGKNRNLYTLTPMTT